MYDHIPRSHFMLTLIQDGQHHILYLKDLVLLYSDTSVVRTRMAPTLWISQTVFFSPCQFCVTNFQTLIS
jgi:hypothetical protein